VSGPLDFSPARYRALYGQGYRDADALMTRLDALLSATAAVRHSERLMAERVQRLIPEPPPAVPRLHRDRDRQESTQDGREGADG
jgi:NTE family protein